MKLSAVKQLRFEKVKEAKALADRENLTAEELNQLEKFQSEIEAFEKQISLLERQEQFNSSVSSDQGEKKEVKSMKKHFNLAKAIRGFASQNLDGVEKEIHQLGVEEFGKANKVPSGLVLPSFLFNKMEFVDTITDTTAGATAGQIETIVNQLDIIAAKSHIRQLGMTELNGLSQKVSLPFSKGHTAAKVAEGVTATQGNPTQSAGVLDPTRFQGYDVYSNEFLKVNAASNMIAESMIMAIDQAICKDVFTNAVTANVLTGHLTSSAAAALTWKVVLKLLAALETDNFFMPAFVMSKPILHDLEGIEKVAGAGRFIVENGVLNGEVAKGTSLLPIHDTNKYDIIFGDWRRAYVGYFGGYELLIDPYTLADNGQTKITYVRHADTAVNPYAFASIRNASLSA